MEREIKKRWQRIHLINFIIEEARVKSKGLNAIAIKQQAIIAYAIKSQNLQNADFGSQF